MALGRFADRRPFIQLFKSTHSISISIPLYVKEERETQKHSGIGSRAVDFRNATKATFLTGNTMPALLPSFLLFEGGADGDEFIQSSGGKDIFIHPRQTDPQ